MRIVIATSNQHKLRELKELLKDFDVQLLSLTNFPDCQPVVEDGESFAENALKKAQTVCAFTGLLTIADDSGLEVDCLEGCPGIFSARSAGEGADDRKNYEKLLREIKGVAPENRGARFRCVLAIAAPSGSQRIVDGEYRGFIITEPRGENGFGYDPIFLFPELGLTMAELGMEEKNRLSHRALAVHAATPIIVDLLAE